MSIYLERYAWKEAVFSEYLPDSDLKMVVVIPCHNEPKIAKALLSINQCRLPCKILVLVVVNESEEQHQEVSIQNEKTVTSIKQLQGTLAYELQYVYEKLPPKKAGVGLARKIGMDEAVRFFERLGIDGIIVCFDADCTCESNYLEAIYQYYQDDKKEAGIVFYEHDLSNNTDAILNYEIYLRYYVNALRFAGFQYAYQTLGSCITVKSKRYQKEGGMNTRKAGEDFYFLHKVIPNGNFGEITATTIRPSARVSDRVPFGTGHAINKFLKSNEGIFWTYNPQIFEELKTLIDQVEKFYNRSTPTLSPCTIQFLAEFEFDRYYAEMIAQSTDLLSFRRRFFTWMDGFNILKFVHFSRDHFYVNVELNEALHWLDSACLGNKLDDLSLIETVKKLREIDRKSSF